MRWHLLNTFDEIYILDLHGNSLKKEISPDGSPDINVFDIKAGVAIIIGIKTKQKGKKKLATVYHKDLYGRRADKYSYLQNSGFYEIEWSKLAPQAPLHFFIPKNYDSLEEYNEYIYIPNLFSVYGTQHQDL